MLGILSIWLLITLITMITCVLSSRAICDRCSCSQTNRSAVCYNTLDIFENKFAALRELTIINFTHPLIVPWTNVSGFPSLELLNLSSTRLSCDCRNSWLAFLQNVYNESVISNSSIPLDVQKYYVSNNTLDQNYSVATIFKLPRSIILPRDNFQHCLMKNKNRTIRSYFETKCGRRVQQLDAQASLSPLINDTFRINCSINKRNDLIGNEACIRIQILNIFANVSQLDVPLKCSSSTISDGERLTTSLATFVNNNHDNGVFLCTYVNPYFPRAILQPIYVTGPPQIYEKPGAKDYSKILLVFLVRSYPRAKIDLINKDNQRLVDDALNNKRTNPISIHEIENKIDKGRSVTVLIEYSEFSMNCINGDYEFRACNKFGCDSFSFSIRSGMPDGMCQMYDKVDNKTDTQSQDDNPPLDRTSIHPPPPRVIHDSWIYIVVPFVVVFAVVMVGVLTTCFFLRMFGWSRDKLLTARAARARASLIDWEMSPLSSNPANLSHNVTYVDWLESIKSRVSVFPPEQLDIQKELGEGAFGRVYLAEYSMTGNTQGNDDQHRKTENLYTNLMPSDEKQRFAMKILKNVTGEKLEDLEREMKIMSSLTHPNIVKFYGISFKCGTLALLFECMENGDLVNYLRNNSIENTQCSCPLSYNDLLNVSCQIARGLDYLASEHLVHRDLAARNCLVGQNMLVKISDFGMTRDIYITDYYKMGAHTLVPLRWLPPESILYRKFTSESDVWSFGVLIWEIFSYGKVPWYMYSNSEVLQIIQDGKLLDQPETCPAEIYVLMLGCWAKIPNERFTAHQLLTKLEIILENRLRYCNLVESEHGSLTEKATLLHSPIIS